MLRRTCPAAWRRGFSLYRRRLEENEWGEPVASYDMEHPDFTVADGAEGAVCWQPVQSWQTSGRLTSGEHPAEPGEQPSGVLQGCLFSPLEVSAFDLVRVGEELYEIRSIQHWPGHRKLLAQRVG